MLIKMKGHPVRFAAFCTFFSVFSAVAAPTSDDAAIPRPEDYVQIGKGPTPDVAALAATGNQSTGPSVQTRQRTSSTELKPPPAAPKRTLQPSPLAADKPPARGVMGGMFSAGEGATPTVSSSAENQVGQPWQTASRTGTTSPAASAEPQGPPPLWALLPRELLLYIRENRTWVVSGVVGMLALMWIVSAAVTRGRR